MPQDKTKNRISPRLWWILATMCLLTVMLNIDATAVLLTIPAMASQFHAPLANMQWVINAYVLTSGMFTMVGGSLGDRIGYKKVLVIGTALFVLASMAAGLSNDETWMIASRALQGFSLGLAYPQTFILTNSHFPKEKRGLALGYIVGTMGISLAIGPLIGGLILYYWGWKWIFFVNVPIGILAVFLTIRLCKKDEPKKVPPFDLQGCMLFIMATFALIFALNQSPTIGFSSPYFLFLLIASFVLFWILYRIEKRKKEAFIHFDLFAIKKFKSILFVRMISQFMIMFFLLFVPIYLQNILEMNPLHTGLFMLFLTVILSITSPLVGKWMDHQGDRYPLIISMALFAASCFLLLLISSDNLIVLASSLLLGGMAIGAVFVCTNSAIFLLAPPEKAGNVNGLFYTLAWIFCALGVALAGLILITVSNHSLLNMLELQGLSLSSIQIHDVRQIAHGIVPPDVLENNFSSSLRPQVEGIAKDSFKQGFQAAAFFFLICSWAGFIFSFFIKNTKQPSLEG